jgi:hypothetical protein
MRGGRRDSNPSKLRYLESICANSISRTLHVNVAELSAIMASAKFFAEGKSANSAVYPKILMN